jgi:NAD(P)H-dependent FMN reductase
METGTGTGRVHVLAVSGSLRDASYTYSALRYALRAAADAGATTGTVDVREVDLPLYDPDEGDVGDAAAVKRRIREADAVLLGSPVYHGSYSAAFRNVHDYCGFDEYEDTVVGLVAAAGGGSYGSTLDHMRATVRGVHGLVVPAQVGLRRASSRFETRDGERVLVDDDIADRLADLGRDVVEVAARLAD